MSHLLPAYLPMTLPQGAELPLPPLHVGPAPGPTERTKSQGAAHCLGSTSVLHP
jgi:hypothetical protein